LESARAEFKRLSWVRYVTEDYRPAALKQPARRLFKDAIVWMLNGMSTLASTVDRVRLKYTFEPVGPIHRVKKK
jgi:hypothetical protein